MIVNIPVAFYASILLYLAHSDAIINNGPLSSAVMIILYSLPIVASVFSWISDLPRRFKLSTLYDSDGNSIRSTTFNPSHRYLPFLPDPLFTPEVTYDTIHQYLMEKQQENANTGNNHAAKASWALVTGASKGIGRAIAISRARRNIPLVLVARDFEKLKALSQLIQECYGVKTLVIKCDIGSSKDIDTMMEVLEKNCIDIDILVNNAGLGDTCEFVNMSPEKMDQLNHVNVMGTTKLTKFVGAAMMQKRRGRILFVSSLTGSMPGIPTAAMYAATKCYQRSLSSSLGRELEGYGVGVTCAMPGAVTETGFQRDANMMHSTIFKFPFGILTPEMVAESSVAAMILGRQECFIGWMNVVMGKLCSKLFSARLMILICELSFRPLPFKDIFATKSPEEKKFK